MLNLIHNKSVCLSLSRAERAMSQEHPNSTPRRSFPKPILSAFGSTGSLQRKNRIISDKFNIPSSYTPDTPLKIERSKFVVPSNLSPFALSPKLMMARNLSLNKSTDLKNESFLSNSLNSDSFETAFLNSPSHFSSSALNDSLDFTIDDDMTGHNYNLFIDKKLPYCSDFEIDSSSVSPSIVSEATQESNFVPQNEEAWKSSMVSFLNNWSYSEHAFGKILCVQPFLKYP